MRVSEENGMDPRINTQPRVDEQKTSDRFLRVMKQEKDREGLKDDHSKKNREGGSSESRGMDVTQALSLQVSSPTDLRIGPRMTAGYAPKSTGTGAITMAHIEALAAETGAHVDLLKYSQTDQTLYMSFDSQTLQGLQVQIRQLDGEVAIHFITPSDSVSTLLKNHVSELRETLVAKGIRVGNIAVAHTGAQPSFLKDRDA